MTRHVVAVEGQSAWWRWVIRDEAGAVRMAQFAVREAAEGRGREKP